jgi:tetratricopeptide (TPR) repeat protein
MRRSLLSRGFLSGVLAAGLLLPAVPAGALPPAREKAEWIRLETDNFVFFSNAGERSTHRIAANLERLRSVLLQLSPAMKVRSDQPTFSFVFRNDSSMTPYKPYRNGKRIDLDGFFVSYPEANYMAVKADMSSVEGVVYHEYLHFLLHNNYASLPLWFDEGLAEFYGTFKSNDELAEIGHASPEHIRWLRENPLIPLTDLFAMDSSSRDYNEGSRRGVFYSESWALVHYLLLGNENRRAQALRYFQGLAHGEQGPEAFHRAFHADEATIEKELRDYVRRDLFNYTRFPVEPEAKLRANVHPMPWHETLARLGELLVAEGPEQSAAAAEHFRAALAAKADYGPALAGLGRLEAAAGHHAEARALLEKAAQVTPDDFVLQYRYAIGLLAEGESAENLSKARVALTRAVQVRPEDGNAWARLAETYSAENALPDEALAAFENAHRLLPGQFAAAYNLVLAQSRLGRRDEAADLIEQEIVPSFTPEQARQAWTTWRNESANHAEVLIGRQELDDAAAMLEDIRKRLPPDLAQPIADRLAEIRRVSAHNRFAARYNEALGLLQKQQLAEALPILQDLAGSAPDPDRAESVRQLTEQVETMLKARQPSPKKRP